MPQPMSRLDPTADISLAEGIYKPSEVNAATAVLALDVIVEWSKVELALTTLFISIMGEEARQAAAVFATIRSPAGQKDAIRAAIRTRAWGEETGHILMAVIEVYATSGKARNRIAHWVWGTSARYPQHVLLADPVAMAVRRAAMTERQAKSLDIPPLPPNRERIFAYDANDFRAAVAQVAEVRGIIQAAAMAVMSSNMRDFAAAPELGPLSAQPQIRKILDRQNRDRPHQSE